MLYIQSTFDSVISGRFPRLSQYYTERLVSLAYPFENGNPKTGTLANREDSDELLYNAAFHQGLHCLLRQNQPVNAQSI